MDTPTIRALENAAIRTQMVLIALDDLDRVASAGGLVTPETQERLHRVTESVTGTLNEVLEAASRAQPDETRMTVPAIRRDVVNTARKLFSGVIRSTALVPKRLGLPGDAVDESEALRTLLHAELAASFIGDAFIALMHNELDYLDSRALSVPLTEADTYLAQLQLAHLVALAAYRGLPYDHIRLAFWTLYRAAAAEPTLEMARNLTATPTIIIASRLPR